MSGRKRERGRLRTTRLGEVFFIVIIYRILLPHIRLEEDARVPDYPANVVQRQSDKQVFMHLDSAAVQTPEYSPSKRKRKRDDTHAVT